MVDGGWWMVAGGWWLHVNHVDNCGISDLSLAWLAFDKEQMSVVYRVEERVDSCLFKRSNHKLTVDPLHPGWWPSPSVRHR